MSQLEFLKEYQSLPHHLQKKVEDLIAQLKSSLQTSKPEHDKPSKRILGIGQGKGWMSPDFDEPLDEMKEYME